MNCKIQNILHLLGQKWTILLLFKFCNSPEKSIRYSEVERTIQNITPKILSLRLQQLVEEHILKKRVGNDTPSKSVTYALTEKGRALIPVIISIREWTRSHSVCEHRETCEKCQF